MPIKINNLPQVFPSKVEGMSRSDRGVLGRFRFFLLTLLFVIPSFLSLVILPFFTFHDEVQIVNLHQYIKAIDLGQFPPRWASDMHFNYGSPFPEFNYQLPYYVGYLLHSAGLTLTVTFKVLIALSFVLGALGMYLLSLELTAPFWAFVAAIIYTYTPYRAVVGYVRGTLGEAFALLFFPWVFYALYRLRKHTSMPAIIFAGLAVAGLILSHQLAAILALPVIVTIVFGDNLFHRRWLSLRNQLIGLVLGALISAFYWLPVLLEKRFVQESSPFNFYDHFPFFKQLIYSPWGYGASTWGPYDGLSFQLGFANMAVMAIAIIFLIKIIKNGIHKVFPSKVEGMSRSDRGVLFIITLLSFLTVIFLMNIRSSFFWNIFPFTQLVQFPWRLLMLTTFFAPLIFATFSPHIPQRFILPTSVVILFLAVYPSFSYFQPGEVFDRGDNYYLHRFLPNAVLNQGETISSEYLQHAEDYVPLPVGAIRPNRLPDAKVTAIRSFSFRSSISDNPLDYQFEIGQAQDQPFVFHTFYFPGWRAAVDQSTVKITTDEHGYITFPVPQGIHQVQIVYEQTPLRKLADQISFITLIVLFECYLLSQLAKAATIKTKNSNNL